MKGRDLLGLSFRLIAMLFLAIAGGSAVGTILFLRSATPVNATIVEYQSTDTRIRLMPDASPGGSTFYPVAEFIVAGTRHRITGRSGSPSPTVEIGTPVSVMADLENPSSARFNSVMGLWGGAIILAAIGVGFLLLSYLAPLGFRSAGGSHA